MKVNFLHGKKKYTFSVPKDINELTIENYSKLKETLNITEKLKDVDKTLQIVSTLSNIPLKALKTIDTESIGKLIVYVNKFLTSQPNTELNNIITVDGKSYGINTDLENMTLGEFIDLETYIKDIDNNLHMVMSVLYRLVTKRKGKKYNTKDYKPNRDKASLFEKNIKIKDIYGASLHLLKFREKLYNDFEQLFTGVEEDTGVNSYNNIGAKWGWYNHLYLLSNENILNIEKVTKLPVYECLTFMSYKQDLNQKLENERRIN